MAKPIAATPVVKGEDARRVLNRMRPDHRLTRKERAVLDRALREAKPTPSEGRRKKTA